MIPSPSRARCFAFHLSRCHLQYLRVAGRLWQKVATPQAAPWCSWRLGQLCGRWCTLKIVSLQWGAVAHVWGSITHLEGRRDQAPYHRAPKLLCHLSADTYVRAFVNAADTHMLDSLSGPSWSLAVLLWATGTYSWKSVRMCAVATYCCDPRKKIVSRVWYRRTMRAALFGRERICNCPRALLGSTFES